MNIAKTGTVNAEYLFEDVDLSQVDLEDEQTEKLTELGYPVLQNGIKAQVAKDHIIVREFIEW